MAVRWCISSRSIASLRTFRCTPSVHDAVTERARGGAFSGAGPAAAAGRVFALLRDPRRIRGGRRSRGDPSIESSLRGGIRRPTRPHYAAEAGAELLRHRPHRLLPVQPRPGSQRAVEVICTNSGASCGHTSREECRLDTSAIELTTGSYPASSGGWETG